MDVLNLILGERIVYMDLVEAESIAFKPLKKERLTSVIDALAAWVVLTYFDKDTLAADLKESLKGISGPLDDSIETATELMAPLEKAGQQAFEKGGGKCMAGILGGAIQGGISGGSFGPWGAAGGVIGGGLLGSLAGGCWD